MAFRRTRFSEDGDAEQLQSPDRPADDDKPTTYQPANLPRDERSEPYEPSDSDAGQAEASSVPAGFRLRPLRMSAPVRSAEIPMRPSPSRPTPSAQDVIHPAPEAAPVEPAAPAAEFGAGTEPAPVRGRLHR